MTDDPRHERIRAASSDAGKHIGDAVLDAVRDQLAILQETSDPEIRITEIVITAITAGLCAHFNALLDELGGEMPDRTKAAAYDRWYAATWVKDSYSGATIATHAFAAGWDAALAAVAVRRAGG